jgi:hypothetical protein
LQKYLVFYTNIVRSSSSSSIYLLNFAKVFDVIIIIIAAILTSIDKCILNNKISKKLPKYYDIKMQAYMVIKLQLKAWD